MRKLFGTDGIRGVAGVAPLDETTVYAVGLALAHSLRPLSITPRVVAGRDTRESSGWILQMLAAGLRSGGAELVSAGVLPTPAVAYLTRRHGFQAGVVISASHNPWQDNGIKLFGGDGFKLADGVELAIEDVIFRHAITAIAPPLDSLPALIDEPKYAAEYLGFLKSLVPGLSLAGQRIVVDCAHGAATGIAQELFGALPGNPPGGFGGDLLLINTSPTGRNINDHCGALHPDAVAAAVVEHRADLGITLDGDADRCLFAGARNNVMNGDAILLLCARDMASRGLLTGNMVVATTMSNMGLEAALRRSGIAMLRANVGDRYVLETMQQHDAALGGEQSGHLLFPHLATTGDGLLTALVVLETLARSAKSMEALTDDLRVYPQVIVNVKVREKLPLQGFPAIAETIRQAESALAGTGRVVIRYSGTEALARVMIEAESEAAMRLHAEAIAGAIRAELGA